MARGAVLPRQEHVLQVYASWTSRERRLACPAMMPSASPCPIETGGRALVALQRRPQEWLNTPNPCFQDGQPCPARPSGAVVNRAINYSMSAREFRSSKGSCLSAADEVQDPWCDVSSDCAGAKRYIYGVIRSHTVSRRERGMRVQGSHASSCRFDPQDERNCLVAKTVVFQLCTLVLLRFLTWSV